MKKLLLAFLLLALAPFASADGTIAPFPFHYFPNNTGTPCNGCQLFAYAAGTTTKQNTYTSSTLGTAQSNPIVLNSTGRPTSPIFLDALSYKFVLAPANDTDPPVSPIWTVDNVSATAAFNISLDISGTAGETLTANDAVYLSDGSGGLTAGRWYKADADNTYSSTAANALGNVLANASAADTISIRLVGRVTGLAGLSTSSLYYISATAGGITTSAPANARPFAVADSTTSIILSQWIPIRDASATQSGVVNTTTQSFAGAKTFTGAVTVNGAVDFDSTGNVDGAFTNPSQTQAAFGAAPKFYPGTSSTAYANASGRITTDTTTHSMTGTTETDLATYTLKGNSLSEDGKIIRVTAAGTFTNTGGTKTLALYLGASSVTCYASTVGQSTWTLTADIVRTGAATQSVYGGIVEFTGTTGRSFQSTSFNQTLSGDLTLKFTGDGSGASDGVTQTYFVVEIIG